MLTVQARSQRFAGTRLDHGADYHKRKEELLQEDSKRKAKFQTELEEARAKKKVRSEAVSFFFSCMNSCYNGVLRRTNLFLHLVARVA